MNTSELRKLVLELDQSLKIRFYEVAYLSKQLLAGAQIQTPVTTEREEMLSRIIEGLLDSVSRVQSQELELKKLIVTYSGYFDAKWYLELYPDVERAGIDPLEHFVRWGDAEHRRPGPGFDPNKYVSKSDENAALSPFFYFLVRRTVKSD